MQEASLHVCFYLLTIYADTYICIYVNINIYIYIYLIYVGVRAGGGGGMGEESRFGGVI